MDGKGGIARRGAAAFLSRIANLISAFTERFPNLSKALAMATAAVLAITAATFFLGLGLNLAKTSLNSIKGAFLRLTASAVPATTATGAFGAAATGAGAGAKVLASGLRSVMAATGIGAVLIGLGYAISLLIDNWDEVVASMRRAWNWVTTTWSQLGVFFTELGNNLLAIFDLAWDDIGAMADSAVQWVEDVWNGIGEFFTGLWNSITGIHSGGNPWQVRGCGGLGMRHGPAKGGGEKGKARWQSSCASARPDQPHPEF